MTEYARERLLQVAGYLPRPLRQTIYSLPKKMQGEIEEICLRNGRPMTVLTREGELPTGSVVSTEDLELALEIASQSSAYTVLNQVKSGFISLRGGHRLGLCGTGVVKKGEVTKG